MLTYSTPIPCIIGFPTQSNGEMMAYSTSNAYERALDVVKAGLASGTIKLEGSSRMEAANANQAQNDSLYLNTLINSIAQNLMNVAPYQSKD
jgi:hypothetical protein